MINSTSALVSQRRVTLYGARAREIPEDSAERAIRQELRLVLPDVFGGIVSDTPSSTALLSQCPELMSATRFEHDRIFRAWLLPLLRKRVLRYSPPPLLIHRQTAECFKQSGTRYSHDPGFSANLLHCHRVNVPNKMLSKSPGCKSLPTYSY